MRLHASGLSAQECFKPWNVSIPKVPYGKISFEDLAPIMTQLSVQALCDNVCPFYMEDDAKEAHV